MRETEALHYHQGLRSGKIQISATKPCVTQRDLSLAYTPGVTFPCRRIEAEAESVYEFTAKGNLVACMTNGTALLDLGEVGPLVAKPAMEGKAVLFKRFADIDVYDLEVDTRDPEEIVRVARLLAPTFGAISIEDIKAPDCFAIEEQLRRELDIPVSHDAQHGTAIVCGAALLNALELVGKELGAVRVVIDGRGAAGIACADLYVLLGVSRENLLLLDSHGVVYEGREEGMDPYKAAHAAGTPLRTLPQALEGADVFVGFSVEADLNADVLGSMSDRPIIFTLGRPYPKNLHGRVKEARPDAIVATSSPDYSNQISSVLAFPFLFRGALDTRATSINEEMRIAAVQALADLVREDAPDAISGAYSDTDLAFGPDYIIPKPLDSRVLLRVAPAVAQAAVAAGVARQRIDLDAYPAQLERRLGYGHEVVRKLYAMASAEPLKVVFPEGEEERVIRACQIIVEEGIAHPVLLGSRAVIERAAQEHHLDLARVSIETPEDAPRFDKYCEELFRLRHRKGVTREMARRMMLERKYFGAMMVHTGDADGLISGLTTSYPETIRPALQVLGMAQERRLVAAVHIVVLENEVFFIADTMVNIEPSSEDLVEIALGTVEVARKMNVEPRVALLSFSNFGSVRHPLTDRVSEAARMLRELDPELEVDGEMQADTAVEPTILKALFPFSRLQSRANVLIFPDLQSGNIGCKLLQRLGGALTIGPILMGLDKPFHALERGCSVASIVRMTAVAVVEGQRAQRRA